MQLISIFKQSREQWDGYAKKFTNVHPLNAYGWGQVRMVDGWVPLYYLVKDDEKVKGMFMILSKKIPFTFNTIWYAPKFTLFDYKDKETIKFIVDNIKLLGKKNNVIFLRIDPNIHERDIKEGLDPFEEEGFIHLSQRWSFWNSPRDVYRIDLTKNNTSDDLFKSLERDVRRCIRKAKNDGVYIKKAESIDDLVRFYNIFYQFSVDKRFMCRSLRYQETLWNEYIAKGDGQLFIAVFEGHIIGGIICIKFGEKCLAMHMGTLSQYNKLHATYAFVWESIRWAKENDCVWYSFRGVGTTKTQESFKRKFNPQATALVGYYDLPLNLFLYKIFIFIEFAILPKIWKNLMLIRKFYTIIFESYIKFKSLVSSQ